jgi:hypothetical protein
MENCLRSRIFAGRDMRYLHLGAALDREPARQIFLGVRGGRWCEKRGVLGGMKNKGDGG